MQPWRLLALLLVVQPAAGRGADDPPTKIPVRLEARADFIALPPAGDPPTFAAAPIVRAVDPKTGRAFDLSDDHLGFDPKRFRRTFRLESADVLLGEPVLVEFRTELGDGEWKEYSGGNTRWALRDDTFHFALRHRDGAWVADTFEGHEPSHFGGPMGVSEVNQLDPAIAWNALQLWCAIDRPGVYDLYAFHRTAGAVRVGCRAGIEAALSAEQRERVLVLDEDGRLLDRATQQPSSDLAIDLDLKPGAFEPPSPIADRIPADVRARFPGWAERATEFAHLTLTVRAGTAAERRAMVDRWIDLPEVKVDTYQQRQQAEEHDAMARAAICLARQGDFLPKLAEMVESHNLPFYEPALVAIGLALRDDPRAVPLTDRRRVARVGRGVRLPPAGATAGGDPAADRPADGAAERHAGRRRATPPGVDRPGLRPHLGDLRLAAADARRGPRHAARLPGLVGPQRRDVRPEVTAHGTARRIR